MEILREILFVDYPLFGGLVIMFSIIFVCAFIFWCATGFGKKKTNDNLARATANNANENKDNFRDDWGYEDNNRAPAYNASVNAENDSFQADDKNKEKEVEDSNANVDAWGDENLTDEKVEEPKAEEKEATAEPKAEEKEEVAEPATKEKKNEEKQEEVKQKNDNDESKEPEKKKGNYRVIYDKSKDEWVIKRDGSSRATKRVKTKDEALKVAKQLSESQDVNVASIQKKDGKFQKKSNVNM